MTDIRRRELLGLLLLSAAQLDLGGRTAFAKDSGGGGEGGSGGGGGEGGDSGGGEGGEGGSGSGGEGGDSGGEGGDSGGEGGEGGDSGGEGGEGGDSGGEGGEGGEGGQSSSGGGVRGSFNNGGRNTRTGGRDDYTGGRRGNASRAQRAIKSGKARPLSEILPVVKKRYKGRVIGVNFGSQGKVPVYRVKVVSSSGRVVVVVVNAVNKRVIAVRNY